MNKTTIIVLVVVVAVVGIVAYMMLSKNTGSTTTSVTKTGGGAGLLQGIGGFFGMKSAATKAAETEANKKAAANAAMQIGSMFY